MFSKGVAQCNLTNPGLGFATCDDNGTPGDSSDDIYTFPLDPVGTNLGSGYTVTPSNGNLSPAGGTYGGPTIFTLTGVPPGIGVGLIVTDNDDPTCTTNTTINPPPCSVAPPCSINFLLVGNVTCNDNGTPNDASDDTFTVDVNVTGSGGSPSGWTASDPLNTSGQYDVFTVLGPYPISGGGFVLQITDNDDPSCTTIPVVIQPPAPCSNSAPCNIEESGLFSISCVTNETPDPADDYVAFTLNPTGVNLGTLYTVSITPGTIVPPQGVYGATTSFFTEPGSGSSGDFTVTITDNDDPNCTFTFTLVNPCSGLCTISASPTLPVCDDNGTPSDPSDDIFTFDVLVSGSNTGTSWTANDPNNTTGNYDVITSFGPYPISGGPLFITIADDDDPTCLFAFTVNPPATCSNDCDLQQANISNISCNNNGTPFDPSDDFIVFSLDPFGQNLGTTYTVTSPSGPIIPNSGGYGSSSVFQTSPGTAGNGPVQLTITDANDPGCSLTITLTDPGDCSSTCDIDPILQSVECQDSGTPSIPGDDLFTVTIIVNGTGSGWEADDPGNSTGIFGESVFIGPFAIINGPVTLTFTSLDDPNCQEILTIAPPPPCSDQCIIQTTITNTQCDDNGTPQDTNDDTFTFLLTVSGINAGINWVAGPPVNETGPYDVPILLGPFSTAQPNIIFTINDNNNSSCIAVVDVPSPGSCSSGCSSVDSTLIDIESCNPLDTGVVIENYFDVEGCDSIVITTTSLLPSDTIQIFSESCNPQDSGVIEIVLSNQFGCDSLVLITTDFALSDTTLLSNKSCNPQDTGIVEVLLSNQFGCDSLIITSTDFALSDTTLLFNESCNPQDTGTVEVLLSNQFGCDSLVITSTDFALSDTTLLSNESCNPQDTGVVEVILSNQFGCDSLVVTFTVFAQSDTTLLSNESCNPQDTGFIEVILSNQFGCDSLIIITTSLQPFSSSMQLPEVCFGESLVINGTTYNASNPAGIDTLTASNGCDSLVYVELQFSNPPGTEFIDTTLCMGEELVVNGQVYNENLPSGIQMISGQDGCDSLLIEIELTFVEIEIDFQVNQPLCEGVPGEILIETVNGGNLPYSYQFNGEPLQNINDLPLVLEDIMPGSYLLEISDNNGCSEQQNLTIQEGIEPIVDLGGEITLKVGEEATLNPVINFDYESLNWTPLSVLNCENCLNPIVSSTEDVIISLIASNEDGCIAEDSILLRITQDFSYYAPNIFSPNGDGTNDYFTIYGDNKQVTQIRRLAIFDRWGNQVFLGSDLTPGDSKQGWNGSFRGNQLNQGVFVFLAELELSDGKIVPIKGEITLIR